MTFYVTKKFLEVDPNKTYFLCQASPLGEQKMGFYICVYKTLLKELYCNQLMLNLKMRGVKI